MKWTVLGVMALVGCAAGPVPDEVRFDAGSIATFECSDGEALGTTIVLDPAAMKEFAGGVGTHPNPQPQESIECGPFDVTAWRNGDVVFSGEYCRESEAPLRLKQWLRRYACP